MMIMVPPKDLTLNICGYVLTRWRFVKKNLQSIKLSFSFLLASKRFQKCTSQAATARIHLKKEPLRKQLITIITEDTASVRYIGRSVNRKCVFQKHII